MMKVAGSFPASTRVPASLWRCLSPFTLYRLGWVLLEPISWREGLTHVRTCKSIVNRNNRLDFTLQLHPSAVGEDLRWLVMRLVGHFCAGLNPIAKVNVG